MLRHVTIIPFIPGVPPTWLPDGDSFLVCDGRYVECLDIEKKIIDVSNECKMIRNSQVVRVLFTEKRLGYPSTMNFASEIAFNEGYDLALLWNSDARITHGSVSELVTGFSYRNMGAYAPSLISNRKGELANIGVEESYAADFVSPYVSITNDGPIKIAKLRNEGEFINVDGFDYAPLFMVRLEAFLGCGGFDPAFSPGYYEDADLWIRLRRYGWKTEATTNVLYEHGDSNGVPSVTFRSLYSSEQIYEHASRCLGMLLSKLGMTRSPSIPFGLSLLSPLLKSRETESIARAARARERLSRQSDTDSSEVSSTPQEPTV